MKKILCVLLAMLCLFSCTACKNGKKSKNHFFGDLGDNTATHIKTVVDYTFKDSTGKSNTFTGNYSTKINGEDSITEFSYERYADIGDEDSVNGVKTVTGKIFKKDGKITTSGGSIGKNEATDGFNLKLNLSEDSLDEYTLSEDKTTMTATVSGENIAKALGVALKTTGGVSLKLTGDGTNILTMDVSYTTETGATVLIRTTFAYGEIALDFGA